MAQDELPNDFLEVSFACGAEGSGSSCGDCRRKTDINFLGGVRPISIRRKPAESGFSCLMLVVRERLRFCHSARLMSRGNRPRFLVR